MSFCVAALLLAVPLATRPPTHSPIHPPTVLQRLEAHPKVLRVHYPGLASHPDHAIAAAQMSGFGGVVSFEVDGDRQRASDFIDAVCLPYMG